MKINNSEAPRDESRNTRNVDGHPQRRLDQRLMAEILETGGNNPIDLWL